MNENQKLIDLDDQEFAQALNRLLYKYGDLRKASRHTNDTYWELRTRAKNLGYKFVQCLAPINSPLIEPGEGYVSI